MASGTGIGEFYISLLVDAAEGSLTVGNLVSSFGALEVVTLAEIGLLYEMGVLLARVTDDGIKASLGFEQFTMHTGLSAQELQKWQIVARQSHASAEDVTGSVENLAKHLANLAVGIPDGALAGLQQLGISAFDASGKTKDAFEILGEVRKRLGEVTSDATQQERILAGLGIAPNLRETLLLTQQAFDARAGLAHGMTGGQEQTFDQTRQALVELSLRAKDVGYAIGAWISPEVTRWVHWIEGVFDTIRTGLKEFDSSTHLFSSGGQFLRADYNAVGDLLNVFAGKGLDVGDLARQRDRMGGAVQDMLGDFLLPKLWSNPAAGAGPTQVTVQHSPTYHIHDAHDPQKIRDVIERDFDDMMGRKVIDGFDRQNLNGGY